MRMRTSAVVTQNVRLHRTATQSRSPKNRSRFMPVQNVPSAKSRSRQITNRTNRAKRLKRLIVDKLIDDNKLVGFPAQTVKQPWLPCLTGSPVTSPFIRRPVSVMSAVVFPPWSFWFIPSRLRRHRSIRALLLNDFRSVPVGHSHLSSCCYLIIDFGSHRIDGSCARTWAQSPQLGGSIRRYATALTPLWLLRSRS
jgi:hypothetical protein